MAKASVGLKARQELPDGAIGPIVMDDFGDVTAMIYSLVLRCHSSRAKYWANRLKSELKSWKQWEKSIFWASKKR